MAQTLSSAMIVPEVYGDMAQAEFLGQVKVGASAAVLVDNTLQGQPGETVHFPKWGGLGELDDLSENTAIVPEALTTDDSEATIKEAGKGVEITDRSRLVGLGDPLAEARRQFGVLAARKVDADLIAAAIVDENGGTAGGTPLTVDTAEDAVLSWAVINDAIAEFGDEWEPSDFAGLFIRSEQRKDLFNDQQFIDASKLGGGDTPVRRGQIGVIGGVPVFVTNRLPGAATGTNGSAVLLKNNSLGLLYKQRPVVEQDRDILARSTILTTTLHYAVKRLSDKGVCVINFTNAA